MFAVTAGLFGIELECVLLLCSSVRSCLWYSQYILYVHWYPGVACECCMWLCLTRSHERPSLRSPTTQTAGGEVHSAEPPLFPPSAFAPTGGGFGDHVGSAGLKCKLNKARHVIRSIKPFTALEVLRMTLSSFHSIIRNIFGGIHLRVNLRYYEFW